MSATKVAIVGGGVIGLTTAWELRRRGAEVVVLEMGELGSGASYGNAGWVVPSLSDPVPSPGLTAQSLRMILNPESPFHIRPAALPGMLPWLWKFRGHCNERDFMAGFRATAELNKAVMRGYDSLVESGVRFEAHERGLLCVAAKPETLNHFADEVRFLESLGYPPVQHLSAGDVRDLEPALSEKIIGGILTQGDRHVRPDTLIAGLEEWLRERGTGIRTNEPLIGVDRSTGRVELASTAAATLTADAYVLAAGAWSGKLAAGFGVKLPIQSGNGYSITIPQPDIQLSHPMYIPEARLAVTPFNDQLRLAGTMELAGLDARPNPKRFTAIRMAAAPFFPDWRVDTPAEEWMGMRPMTPDGLPVIGRVLSNVYVATGHAMLGVTMATVTATAIADLILDGSTTLPVDPFSPARFNP